MARPRLPNAVFQAFDEAQFGETRTLNLRDGLPTGAEAAARADAWLRLKQVEGAHEVLIITGRGAHSADGVPVVRTYVAKKLASLRRTGVVASVSEHTPGSYVVGLSSVSAMLTAPQRAPRKATAGVPNVTVPSLSGLTSDTQRLVREVAARTLESLGIQATTRTIVADEIERQAELLSRSMPRDANREQWIRGAALRILNESE